MQEHATSVFIHGLGQGPSSWYAVSSHLSGAAQIHCPDLCLLGNGEQVTYNNLYHAFENYCMSLSAPLKLCGISLGAILAMNYAIDHPEKTVSLVVIAPQYKIPKLLFRLQNLIFRFMPQTAFGAGFDKKQTICLMNSMQNLNFSLILKNICCPVLVVCGQNDQANRKAAKDIVTLIPDTELCFIKNAGHEINIDAPKDLANVINTFWQK